MRRTRKTSSALQMVLRRRKFPTRWGQQLPRQPRPMRRTTQGLPWLRAECGKEAEWLLSEEAPESCNHVIHALVFEIGSSPCASSHKLWPESPVSGTGTIRSRMLRTVAKMCRPGIFVAQASKHAKGGTKHIAKGGISRRARNHMDVPQKCEGGSQI